MSDKGIIISTKEQITLAIPEYHCEHHGNIGGAIMQIKIRNDGITHHCLACLRHLVPQAYEITEPTKPGT